MSFKTISLVIIFLGLLSNSVFAGCRNNIDLGNNTLTKTNAGIISVPAGAAGAPQDRPLALAESGSVIFAGSNLNFQLSDPLTRGFTVTIIAKNINANETINISQTGEMALTSPLLFNNSTSTAAVASLRETDSSALIICELPDACTILGDVRLATP